MHTHIHTHTQTHLCAVGKGLFRVEVAAIERAGGGDGNIVYTCASVWGVRVAHVEVAGSVRQFVHTMSEPFRCAVVTQKLGAVRRRLRDKHSDRHIQRWPILNWQRPAQIPHCAWCEGSCGRICRGGPNSNTLTHSCTHNGDTRLCGISSRMGQLRWQ